MHLIFCLSVILTEFRPLFKYQNFHLFSVFVVGLINQKGGDADRHLSSGSSENGLPCEQNAAHHRAVSMGNPETDQEPFESIKFMDHGYCTRR